MQLATFVVMVMYSFYINSLMNRLPNRSDMIVLDECNNTDSKTAKQSRKNTTARQIFMEIRRLKPAYYLVAFAKLTTTACYKIGD